MSTRLVDVRRQAAIAAIGHCSLWPVKAGQQNFSLCQGSVSAMSSFPSIVSAVLPVRLGYSICSPALGCSARELLPLVKVCPSAVSRFCFSRLVLLAPRVHALPGSLLNYACYSSRSFANATNASTRSEEHGKREQPNQPTAGSTSSMGDSDHTINRFTSPLLGTDPVRDCVGLEQCCFRLQKQGCWWIGRSRRPTDRRTTCSERRMPPFLSPCPAQAAATVLLIPAADGRHGPRQKQQLEPPNYPSIAPSLRSNRKWGLCPQTKSRLKTSLT